MLFINQFGKQEGQACLDVPPILLPTRDPYVTKSWDDFLVCGRVYLVGVETDIYNIGVPKDSFMYKWRLPGFTLKSNSLHLAVGDGNLKYYSQEGPSRRRARVRCRKGPFGFWSSRRHRSRPRVQRNRDSRKNIKSKDCGRTSTVCAFTDNRVRLPVFRSVLIRNFFYSETGQKPVRTVILGRILWVHSFFVQCIKEMDVYDTLLFWNLVIIWTWSLSFDNIRV